MSVIDFGFVVICGAFLAHMVWAGINLITHSRD